MSKMNDKDLENIAGGLHDVDALTQKQRSDPDPGTVDGGRTGGVQGGGTSDDEPGGSDGNDTTDTFGQ